MLIGALNLHPVLQSEHDGQLLPVNASTATRPSLRGTWFISLAVGMLTKPKGGASDSSAAVAESEETDDELTDSDTRGAGNENRPTQDSVISKRPGNDPAVKAGGKRRKAVRKR